MKIQAFRFSTALAVVLLIGGLCLIGAALATT